MMKDSEISISTSTIFKVLIILGALWLAYIIKPVLLILFVSLILAALIDPFADWFQKRKIPRGIAVMILYLILITLFAGVVLIIVPPIVTETKTLIENFGTIWENLVTRLGTIGRLGKEYGIIPERFDYNILKPGDVAGTVKGIFTTIGGFFVGIASVLLAFVMAFYMVVEEDGLKKILRNVVPAHYHPFMSQLLYRVRDRLGGWIRGQFVLSLVIGIIVYIGLTVIGAEYAAVLAIVAAILELIPYVGPVLAGAAAIFLTFAQSGSGLKTLLVLLLFVAMQQVENNILVPKVMEKSVGLNPIVSIAAMMVGVQLAGFLGVLLAIPVATAVSVFIEELLEARREA